MKFCTSCGSKVTLQIPQGDDRERHVCPECEIIHYSNPTIIAGALPYYGDKVLLCKRAIEPRYGMWTLPAGFMENGESVEEGALRECWEEAETKLRLDGLYTVFSLPEINQVYMLFRGEVLNGEFGVGPESLESELYSEEDIPWSELAFPVIRRTLQHYFSDRKTGHFPVRSEALYRHIKR